MTARMTNQERRADGKSRPMPDFSAYKRCDSYLNPTASGSPEDGAPPHPHRVSQQQLAKLLTRLSARDWAILTSIRRCRYLMSGQVERLHFDDAANPAAALRASNRNLKKLKEMGLVAAFSRRIGGVRAGSGSYIWHVTDAGERLLRLHYPDAPKRNRFFEPSPFFLAHTLAVAECFVRLTEICAAHPELSLSVLQPEPECWRVYARHGKQVALKPDLFAATICDSYEDRWFIEIDLATESPAKVLEKCGRYHEYYQTGLEQREFGVFPLVVWLVPDAARKAHLTASLNAAFDKLPHIFTVITPDELAPLVRQGLEGGVLC